MEVIRMIICIRFQKSCSINVLPILLKLLCKIDGDATPLRAAALYSAWHESWGDEVSTKIHSSGSVSCTITRSRLHEVGEFSSPADPFPPSLERAITRAWQTVIAYDCPGVRAIPRGCMTDPGSPWGMEFEMS